MATGPQPGDAPQPGLVNQGDAMLKAMDREIISLKRQVSRYRPLVSLCRTTTGLPGRETHSHSTTTLLPAHLRLPVPTYSYHEAAR